MVHTDKYDYSAYPTAKAAKLSQENSSVDF